MTSDIAKVSKVCSVIALAVFFYTFVGAVTYQLHESMYPGCTQHPAVEDRCDNYSSLVGAAWPISLPATAAIYVVKHAPPTP